MNRVRIAIPSPVVRALRDVESKQLADMYDRESVLRLSGSFGHGEAADWMSLHRHLYFRALEQARFGRSGRTIPVR